MSYIIPMHTNAHDGYFIAPGKSFVKSRRHDFNKSSDRLCRNNRLVNRDNNQVLLPTSDTYQQFWVGNRSDMYCMDLIDYNTYIIYVSLKL